MDSELVIACHCEVYEKLYFYNPDGSSRPLDGETYVDPDECPDKTWDKIPSNSKQIIWGQFCPVYSAFRLGSKHSELEPILRESLRVLKLGGVVIFPLSQKKKEEIKFYPAFDGFRINIKENDGLPVNIGIEDSNIKRNSPFLIIYTKISKGGGKMRLKTIRRSHRPEKKWDALFETDKGKEKVVSFGAAGMSDYTKHKDKTRKARYLKRHGNMGESWNKPDTPGALSRWVLWNKPSFKASVADFKKRFKL